MTWRPATCMTWRHALCGAVRHAMCATWRLLICATPRQSMHATRRPTWARRGNPQWLPVGVEPQGRQHPSGCRDFRPDRGIQRIENSVWKTRVHRGRTVDTRPMRNTRNHRLAGVTFGGCERGAGCGCVGHGEWIGGKRFVTQGGVITRLGTKPAEICLFFSVIGRRVAGECESKCCGFSRGRSVKSPLDMRGCFLLGGALGCKVGMGAVWFLSGVGWGGWLR